MIKQVINGRNVHSIYAEGEIDELKSILEGKIEEYKEKASGGKEVAHPDKLNSVRFRLKKDFKSTSMKIHHIDPAKFASDLISSITGKFDASYKLDVKCDTVIPMDYN